MFCTTSVAITTPVSYHDINVGTHYIQLVFHTQFLVEVRQRKRNSRQANSTI
jgi:hypothetical protein